MPTAAPEIEAIRLRKRLHQERAVSWGVIATLAFALWYNYTRGRLYVIEVDGKAVAWLASDTAAARSLARAKEEWRKQLGPGVRFEQADRINEIRSTDRKPMSEAAAVAMVRRALSPQVEAAAIEINGVPAAYLKTSALAREVLDSVKAELQGSRSGGRTQSRWKERVEVVSRFCEPARVVDSAESVIRRIVGAKPSAPTTVTKYTIRAGDTAWTIAQSQGLSLGDLQRLNPGLDFARLKAGKQLVVKQARPGRALLTLVSVRKRTYVEELPPMIQEIPSPALAKGQRRIQKRGKPGRRRITVEVIEENGVTISQKPMVIESLEEPRPTVVLVGAGPGAAPAPAARSTPPRNQRRTGAAPGATRTREVVTRPLSPGRLPPPAPVSH